MTRRHRAEDYFAGLLEGRERADFERHLESCHACKKALEELRRLDERLSTGLAAGREEREPRREWLERVKASVTTQRPGRRRPVALVGLPVATVVVAVILLVVLWPWGGGPGPKEALGQAYRSTLQQPFIGTLTVHAGRELVASGMFRHAPGNRWAVTIAEATGETVEEVQIGDSIWQKRDNGQWEMMGRGKPLVFLPQGVGALDHLPDLLEGVSTLQEVKVLGTNRYSGVDNQYAARLVRDVPPEVSLSPSRWLMEHPPTVEVLLSASRTITRAKLRMETPGGGEPLTVELVLRDYGEPTQIEPP